ncbi:MAG TPA: ATP-binding protein [Armatimonadota bacterium]|nr:ATP-binding protein [Armatimonadota bacterium]
MDDPSGRTGAACCACTSHPVLAAWSSGKDALWALHIARQGDFDVAGLLTTISDPHRRVSMHGVREELVRAQARALGLPLIEVRIPAPCTDEAYSAAMRGALERAKGDGLTGVVFGDLHLADVRAYREERMAQVGMRCHFPLWGRDPDELARAMVAGGVRAYITCLDPRKLPREFAGRAWDRAFLAALPADIDACGENGEFHTFAFDGPGFERPIGVHLGETVEREGFVFTDIVPR